MSFRHHTMTPGALWSLTGTGAAPLVVDVRLDEDRAADPRCIPGALRRPWQAPDSWADQATGRDVIVVCDRGLKISMGVAALLRRSGIRAGVLDGGFQGWKAAGLPLLRTDAAVRPTLWVIDSAPSLPVAAGWWLTRRWLDPLAVALPVAAAQTASVAERFGAGLVGDVRDMAGPIGLAGTLDPVCEMLGDAGLAAVWQGMAALAPDENALLARAAEVCDALWHVARTRTAEAA